MVKSTVFCVVIQKTLQLILRCAAPLFHLPTIYYKDYGAPAPFFRGCTSQLPYGSTTLVKYYIQSGRAAQYAARQLAVEHARFPIGICRKRCTDAVRCRAPNYYHFEFFSKP